MDEYGFLYTIEYLHAHPRLAGLLRFLNIIIPVVAILSYTVLFVWILFFDFPIDKIQAIKLQLIIPAIGFISLTVVRHVLNFKRPYDVYDFAPIINKTRPGKSFPSRHVFSAFMIALTFIAFAVKIPSFSYIPGVVLFFFADILGCIRMVTGVHFPKDVIVGALFAIVLGIAMIFIPV